MIVDISPADTESKMAILQANAKLNNFNLSYDIAYHLASTIDGSIRELVGALNSVICQTQLKGKDLSLAEIKQTTKNSTKPHKTVSVKEVVKAVAAFYNIDEDSIYDKTRKQEVVKPRQMTMYILREDFSVSFPSIGQKLGGRDHTTVIHSCEKIKNELKDNQELTSELNQIRAMI
jgi:chromosomal replication initiator protein